MSIELGLTLLLVLNIGGMVLLWTEISRIRDFFVDWNQRLEDRIDQVSSNGNGYSR